MVFRSLGAMLSREHFLSQLSVVGFVAFIAASLAECQSEGERASEDRFTF